MRTRDWRRAQTKRVQQKRLSNLLSGWWTTISKPNHIGRLKKNHYGCGCTFCKGWKHGLGAPIKISEQRSLPSKERSHVAGSVSWLLDEYGPGFFEE